MHTESDAKQKWCPFTRLSPNGGGFTGSFNRHFRHVDETAKELICDCQCIGSVCMAWRWGHKRNPDYTSQMTWPDNRSEKQKAPFLTDHTCGYCGLAGEPK